MQMLLIGRLGDNQLESQGEEQKLPATFAFLKGEQRKEEIRNKSANV